MKANRAFFSDIIPDEKLIIELLAALLLRSTQAHSIPESSKHTDHILLAKCLGYLGSHHPKVDQNGHLLVDEPHTSSGYRMACNRIVCLGCRHIAWIGLKKKIYHIGYTSYCPQCTTNEAEVRTQNFRYQFPYHELSYFPVEKQAAIQQAVIDRIEFE